MAATDSSAELETRIKTAKGQRPFFFDDPNIDKLLAMFLALVSEVAVLRERLDTHERLTDAGVAANAANVEAFEATDAAEAERAEWRAAYVARIMRIISDELDRLKST